MIDTKDLIAWMDGLRSFADHRPQDMLFFDAIRAKLTAAEHLVNLVDVGAPQSDLDNAVKKWRDA